MFRRQSFESPKTNEDMSEDTFHEEFEAKKKGITVAFTYLMVNKMEILEQGFCRIFTKESRIRRLD